MAQLGWFFAGTSVGLFTGVLIICLARMSQMAARVEEQEYFRPEPPPEHSRLIIMRR